MFTVDNCLPLKKYDKMELTENGTLNRRAPKNERRISMLLSLSLIFDLLIKWPLMLLFGPLALLF